MTHLPDETGARPPLPAASSPWGQGVVAAPFTGLDAVRQTPYAIGRVRPTGTCILLVVVTLGIYSLFWYYGTHSEMQRHRGSGLGGGVALVLGFFVPFVLAFMTPSEVGSLYAARGQKQPVSAATGFWILLPFIGGLIWFVKTNGAINNYWRSLGAA
jgi:hypothetical protein